ncbi:MAG: tRNA (adenosine(37)-N6)-dimethylallyltransferase MiaA [Eubacteriales bacterium]|nr:tRNA (adenosine(37)-N6)-dimethylallyltransferase MiaA [Eubacteriales bacterium]
MDFKTVIVICGPTASGKSSTAISLARLMNNRSDDIQIDTKGAEIVSADSMQIYKELNIGTAKISQTELKEIRHHLINICQPEEYYSAAQFKNDATEAIKDIHSRGKTAIVCGGTGQYLSALIEGIEYVDTPVDIDLRDSLNRRADIEGLSNMFEELKDMDPAAAAKLSISDRKRIIRAHEIIRSTGKTPTEINLLSRQKGPDFQFLTFCLSPDRNLLYERINKRTVMMLEDGWIEETSKIIEAGISEQATSMQAIGYKQIKHYLHGNVDYDHLVNDIQQATRRYAKRQLTWFRKMKDVYWLNNNDNNNNLQEIINIISVC